MPLHLTNSVSSHALTAGAIVFSFCLTADLWAEGRRSRAVHGTVVGVDLKTGTVDLEFACRQRPEVGNRLCVSRAYVFEVVGRGEVEVVYLAKNGLAIARPIGKLGITDVSKGDFVRSKRGSQPKPVSKAAAESVTQSKPASHAGAPATEGLAQSKPAGHADAPAATSIVHFATPKSAKLGAKRTPPKRRTEALPARHAEVKQTVRLLIPNQVR